MRFYTHSDGARESGAKPPASVKNKASASTGIGGDGSTGKVDDVLTRLSDAVLKALSTGATKVDGKELDHGQAEELRQMLGMGYNLAVVSVESLSHLAKKGGDEVWGRGWKPDTSSRVTFQATDPMGQPQGSYGLALTVGSGGKGEKKTAPDAKPKPKQKKQAAKETNTSGSFGFLLRSGITKARKR